MLIDELGPQQKLDDCDTTCPGMGLRYGYIGSTEVSKRILDRLSLDPTVVVSFDDEHRDRISGFATYEEYEEWITVDSIDELVETLNALLGTDLDPIYDDPRPGDVRHSHADVSKACDLLGYEPGVSFEAGLQRTVEFYREP